MTKHIKNIARQEWLLNNDREEGDVMEDADGLEYIISDEWEGEMEEGTMTRGSGKRIYLPESEELIIEANRLAKK